MTAAELKVLVGVYGLEEANRKLLKFDADMKALASSDPTVTLHAEVDIAGFAEFEALKEVAADPVTTTLRAEIDEASFAEAAAWKDAFEDPATAQLRAEASGFDTVIAQLDAIRAMTRVPIVQEVKLEIDKSSLSALGGVAAASTAAGHPGGAMGSSTPESQQRITEDMVALRQWTNSHETFWDSTGPPGGTASPAGDAAAAGAFDAFLAEMAAKGRTGGELLPGQWASRSPDMGQYYQHFGYEPALAPDRSLRLYGPGGEPGTLNFGLAPGAVGEGPAGAAGGGFWSSVLATVLGDKAASSLTGAFGAGGGGGGILKSVLWGGGGSLPFFGKVPLLAGALSLGSMAGLGAEHVLFTGLGLAGSAGGALLGGGLVGAGALGTMAVGGGSDLAVMKSTLTGVKELTTKYDALQQAVKLYGAHSKQAAQASAELHLAMQEIGPAAKAEMVVAKQGEALSNFWSAATADAKVQASHIMSQVLGLGDAYVPLIAHAADRNLSIIDKDLKPLFAWLKGPEGTGIFEHLENVFAHNLPTAMDAFDQGVQLVLKTVSVASNYTGGFVESIDDFFTKWNEPQNFQKWEGEIGHLVGDFHLWLNLIKQLGVDIFDLFSNDAHTGNTIVRTLDGMLVKLHEWETSTSGKNELHNLFTVHKEEIVALLHLIPEFVSAIEPIYMTMAPFLTEAMTEVLGDVGSFLKLLDETGPITRWGLGLTVIAGHLIGFKTVFGTLGKAMWAPFKSMLAQAPLIGGFFTDQESETEKLTAATDGLTGAVNDLTAAYERMGSVAGGALNVLSAEESAQADINTMLYRYGPYAGTIAAENKYGPGAVPAYFGAEGGTPGEIGGRMLGALGKGAMVGLPVWIGSQMLGTAVGGNAGHSISRIGTFAGAGAGLGAAVGTFFPEFGGPITGGLAGAGIGAAVGGITELLRETKHLTSMQKALAASAHLVDQRMSASVHGYSTVEHAQARLQAAERRAHGTAGDLHEAERNLEDVRRRFGPASGPAIQAEAELTLKRHDNARAARAVEQAEQTYGITKQAEKKVVAESVSALKVEIGTLAEKKRAVDEEFQANSQSTELAQKVLFWNEKLSKAQGQLGEEMQKAANLGKPFSDRLSQDGQAAAHFGEHAVVLRREINALDEGMFELKAHGVDRFGLSMEELKTKARTAESGLHEFFQQTRNGWVELSAAAIKHNEASGESVQSLAQVTSEAFRLIAKNTESMATVFGGKIPHFKIDMPAAIVGAHLGRERGGHINLGAPSGDSVPAMLERDEYVLNRRAVAAVGIPTLDALNFGVAPRHLEKGGHAGGLGGEPRLEGDAGALKALGQAAIHAVYQGAEHYLHAHAHAHAHGGGAGPIAVPTGGGSVVAEIARVLFANAFNKIGATGPIGNSYAESTWNPAAMEPGTHNGGLWGFTTGEKSLGSLEAYAAKRRMPWTDVALQTAFMLKTGGLGLRDRLNAAKDPNEAARIFEEGYEAAGIVRMDVREEGARKAYAMGYASGGLIGRAEERRGVPSTSESSRNRSIYSGAGYVFPFTHAQIQWGRIDEGVDFTGTGPIQAIGTGVVTGIMPDWYLNQKLIDYKLTEGPKAGQYVYIAEGIDSSVSVGQQVTAGEQIATFAHGTENDSIETGWGSAGGNGTLADGGSGATGAGQSFYGFLKQLQGGGGWHGSGTSKFKKEEERVPGEFKGAHTGSLSFPSLPTTLHGIAIEMHRWHGELQKYESAVHLATGRPELQRKIQANVTAIQKYLRELERARHKLRKEEARKHYSSHLTKQLGHITGEEKNIEITQRAYEVASQYAEQVVGLEPPEPVLQQVPAGATEAQAREVEEANHGLEVGHLNAYEAFVEGKERPAYLKVLGTEADWRNTILSAESKASGMETSWENQIRTKAAEVETFKQYGQEVEAHLDHWRRSRKKGEGMPPWLKEELATRRRLEQEIPGIRSQESELRKVLGEARQAFYPGFPKALQPPQPPMAGSGQFEQELQEVQGIHWPGQHEHLGVSALMPPRHEGSFGGAIWSTQTVMDELGLQVQQAQAGIGSVGGGAGAGGGSSPGAAEGERTQLLEELLRQAHEREAITEIERQTLSAAHVLPYAGAYESGGMVAALVGEQGPEIVATRPGAYIHTASETSNLLSPTVVVNHYHDEDRTEVEVNGEKVEAIVNRMDRRGSRVARRGLATPGF